MFLEFYSIESIVFELAYMHDILYYTTSITLQKSQGPSLEGRSLILTQFSSYSTSRMSRVRSGTDVGHMSLPRYTIPYQYGSMEQFYNLSGILLWTERHQSTPKIGLANSIRYLPKEKEATTVINTYVQIGETQGQDKLQKQKLRVRVRVMSQGQGYGQGWVQGQGQGQGQGRVRVRVRVRVGVRVGVRVRVAVGVRVSVRVRVSVKVRVRDRARSNKIKKKGMDNARRYEILDYHTAKRTKNKMNCGDMPFYHDRIVMRFKNNMRSRRNNMQKKTEYLVLFTSLFSIHIAFSHSSYLIRITCKRYCVFVMVRQGFS